jgi:hypothetical protein
MKYDSEVIVTPPSTPPRFTAPWPPQTAPLPATPSHFARDGPGGGGDTAPLARALKTVPARAHAREWRGALARGLGADPLRPPAPQTAPLPATPSRFARDAGPPPAMAEAMCLRRSSEAVCVRRSTSSCNSLSHSRARSSLPLSAGDRESQGSSTCTI